MTQRSVAVEEEMFLVDPRTRRLLASSDRVAGDSGADDDHEVEQELFLQQVEIQSEPHADLPGLLSDLVAARAAAAQAAATEGAALAAMPTPVLDDDGDVTPKDRYRRMVRRFGEVGRRALVNGMHVHVDVTDDEEAVAVVDRLRPWLPLVLAMSAGSPFDHGVDTSFASWRAEVWESWPSAGPVEPFGDAAGYRRAVGALVASGAALDEGMVYLDARPARSFPTVEIRVADVCADLDDTVLVAAVSRALVDTVAEQWRSGEPPTPWRVDLLRAARWSARRDGLTRTLLDPTTGAPGPAEDVLQTMLATIAPSLDRHGDRVLVERAVARLLSDGTGAQRQRLVAGPGLDLDAVVDDVLRRTVAAPSASRGRRP